MYNKVFHLLTNKLMILPKRALASNTKITARKLSRKSLKLNSHPLGNENGANEIPLSRVLCIHNDQLKIPCQSKLFCIKMVTHVIYNIILYYMYTVRVCVFRGQAGGRGGGCNVSDLCSICTESM